MVRANTREVSAHHFFGLLECVGDEFCAEVRDTRWSCHDGGPLEAMQTREVKCLLAVE